MAYEEQLLAMNPFIQQIADKLGISVKATLALLAVATVWTLIWKGLALWKSARKNSPIWFVALFVINTVGILEILYIYVFSKMDFKSEKFKIKKK